MAPLSPRARPNAPVSMPVTWPLVKRGLDPVAYTIRSVPQLLKKSKAWADYCEAERSPLEAMARLKRPTVSPRAACTTNPTAEWIARQITQAFPWDDAPKYLIRDRDQIYGAVVTRRLRAMGIRDKPTAPASPWQNGFAERLIGSIRRECVDHIIVLGEVHLRRVLQSYADYYNSVRTHRSLNKDAPVSRPVQRTGVIRSRAILGGLHHRYARV